MLRTGKVSTAYPIHGNVLGHLEGSSAGGTDDLPVGSVRNTDNDGTLAQTQQSHCSKGNNANGSSAKAAVAIGRKTIVHGNLRHFSYSLAKRTWEARKSAAWPACVGGHVRKQQKPVFPKHSLSYFSFPLRRFTGGFLNVISLYLEKLGENLRTRRNIWRILSRLSNRV